jgi:hypothetical protein
VLPGLKIAPRRQECAFLFFQKFFFTVDVGRWGCEDGKVQELFGPALWALIGSVDDLAQKDKRGVLRQLVFFQDRFERTFLAVMTQFDVFDVERNSVESAFASSITFSVRTQTPHPCRRSS